jgi:cell division cycle 2-like protein
MLSPLLLHGCRSVDLYKKLERIEEGTYGIVYRAINKETGEIVALKRLKLDKEREGFPVTSIREISTLLKIDHPNIISLREVVVSDTDVLGIFIVMEYVEHDLKSLMLEIKDPFCISEAKSIMRQLLLAIDVLHSNWIIHRDLKTSNLLYNRQGKVKVADFGLARTYGSPLLAIPTVDYEENKMTPIVVTLWYRAPELVLGQEEYTTAIDMWSIGCIMAELLLNQPLFQGNGEIDQLYQIFQLLGTPNENTWYGFSSLPNLRLISFPDQPYNHLRSKFPMISDNGLDLLNNLFIYDPLKRINAKDALDHVWFRESPLPMEGFLLGQNSKKRQNTFK